MFYSIRARIGIVYVALILAVMLGLGLYISNLIEQTSLRDLEQSLQDEARLVAQLTTPLFQGTPDPEKIDRMAKEIGQLIQARVTIIANDGAVLGESQEDRLKMENHSNRPEILQAGQQGIGSSIRYSATLGREMIYVAVPINAEGARLGYARVALTISDVQMKINQIRTALIGATIIATLMAALLAIWISNRITQPLCDLIEAANQVASGNLETRLIPATRDEIGELTQTFNDMAAQLNARLNELEAERSREAAVLSVMTDGVIIIDSENRVQQINPAAVVMFDVHSASILGRSLFEFVRQHQIDEILSRCRQTGASQSIALEVIARKLYLQVTASPLGPYQPGNTLLLFQDLTRLRRLETIRQDFISNISHELRTPLASLKALTETLQESALEDPPAARRFLERMDTELDALSQMVEELLELSRIESGRVPLKFVAIPPHQLIDQAVERLTMQAERAGLTIEIACPEDLPPAKADPPRLVQVIVNLLHNAIKFSSSGGNIRISARVQKENLLFSVQDNGIGISSADLPRIFERFYKTDRARSGGGTGLGLAIARHLIEAHGGTIWVESLEGEGSTFFFTIPIAD
jgi:two-component system phosphate regulon sensor histidine kinase PhoR